MRKHDHIQKQLKKAGDEAEKRCADNNSKDFEIPASSASYNLSGFQGVGKYMKDYSTLATGGQTGNLAVTFLGSYRATLKVTKIKCCDRTAHVKIDVNNTSTASSGTRPPVLGYTSWWQNNVAPIIDNLFKNGGGSPTSQHIELNEDITFEKTK